MIHVGVSGSRKGLTPQQRGWLTRHLWTLKPSAVLHHGDCVGVDQEVHVLWQANRSYPLTVVHPPTIEAHRAFVDGRETSWRPAASYRERNEQIVQEADVLWAFPEGPEDEHPRSGTWMTVRMARRAAVPVMVVLPNGTVAR